MGNREHVKPVLSESDESDEDYSIEESESESELPQKKEPLLQAPLTTPSQNGLTPPQNRLVSSSDEEEETESDSKSEPPQKPLLQAPLTTPSQNQHVSSSDEEEEETESESDSDTRTDSVVKPPASEPKEQTQKASEKAVTPAKSVSVKRRSEDTDAKEAKKSKKTVKRRSEDTEANEAKKSKKTAEPVNSEKKSTLFSRFWSEEDEIIILKGMIELAEHKKSDRISDINVLYDFLKKKLAKDFTKAQLQDKIKRLKQKYENNKSKGKVGSNKHEQSAYDLSKELWGDLSKELWGKECVKNEMRGYERGKGLEGVDEWKKLRVEELELYQKYSELRTAQTKLVLSIMKGGDH